MGKLINLLKIKEYSRSIDARILTLIKYIFKFNLKK